MTLKQAIRETAAEQFDLAAERARIDGRFSLMALHAETAARIRAGQCDHNALVADAAMASLRNAIAH